LNIIYLSGFKIIDPATSLNAVHEELMLYKGVFENLTQHVKENTIYIHKLEKENTVK